MLPPRALPAAHFERNDVTIICETVHYDLHRLEDRRQKTGVGGRVIHLFDLECLFYGAVATYGSESPFPWGELPEESAVRFR
jgi:hypothetical protein